MSNLPFLLFLFLTLLICLFLFSVISPHSLFPFITISEYFLFFFISISFPFFSLVYPTFPNSASLSLFISEFLFVLLFHLFLYFVLFSSFFSFLFHSVFLSTDIMFNMHVALSETLLLYSLNISNRQPPLRLGRVC
jgi:hypothetical protein